MTTTPELPGSDPAAPPAPGGPGRPAVLTAEELAVILRGRGPLTDAELDALERLDRAHLDPDDDLGEDQDWGVPAEWLMLPAEEQRALLGSDEDLAGLADDPDEDEAPDPEIMDAGFTHRDPAPGAAGFAGGGLLDRMLPGADLAWHAGMARQRGLGSLSDDQLIGVLGAARRLQSWQAELELAATAELDARRAGPDGRDGEHVAAELAAALRLTGRAAQSQLDLSRQLQRLPQTRGLLAAGIIDRPRALVITAELALLDDAAAAAETLIAPGAGAMTTGRLRAACQRAVIACDPQAAIRRREQAQQDARVECWAEAAGTGAIAGRDLDRVKVIAADKALDADARWLAARGRPGTLEQLRAEAFLARLAGQPRHTLLPSDPAAAAAAAGAGPVAGVSGVNVIVPWLSWLELSGTPGEITGTGAAGPADAPTCNTLAHNLARDPATRWSATITDPSGRAVACGRARAGPGPPGSDKRAWLAAITFTPIAARACDHQNQSSGYRPSSLLRNLVKTRSRRCGFPGCRRMAWRCDDDHTIPYDQGGRTCECNMHPLCRQHHQTKQASGWRLDQPQPGVLTWTTPSGRRYTITPEPYPA